MRKASGLSSGKLRVRMRSRTRRYFVRVGFAGRGGAAVAVGDQLQGLRLRLAEAMDAEAQGAVARGCGGDTADEIAIFCPEMQGAAAMLGCELVLRFAHVEDGFAVFEDCGVGMLGEKGFERGGDLLDGLLRLRCGSPARVTLAACATSSSGSGDA